MCLNKAKFERRERLRQALERKSYFEIELAKIKEFDVDERD